MSTQVTVSYQGLTLNQSAMDRMLHSPQGDVGKHLANIAGRIVVAARAQVGVDTAELKNSISFIHGRGTAGQFVKIGSSVAHAYMHHEGTRPHTIAARPEHEFLRFSNGGRVIYSHSIQHPGTRPNRYLSDNLGIVKR